MRSNPPFMPSIAEPMKTPQQGGTRLAAAAEDASLAAPLISVVTVAFNALEPLRRTLASVHGQDARGIEHIIVDANSTDGTVDLLRSLDGELTYWISEPDAGIYDAMNKGLRLARGRYVHFLNAGDTFIELCTLSKVADLLHESPTILMNRVQSINPDGSAGRLLPTALGLSGARAKFRSAYCHQGAFVRRDAYLAVGGFDTIYRHFADFKALWAARAWDDRVLETTLVVVRFPLDGVSSDWRRAVPLIREREHLLAELGDTSSQLTYRMRILKAHLYKLRMMLRHHFQR